MYVSKIYLERYMNDEDQDQLALSGHDLLSKFVYENSKYPDYCSYTWVFSGLIFQKVYFLGC